MTQWTAEMNKKKNYNQGKVEEKGRKHNEKQGVLCRRAGGMEKEQDIGAGCRE